MALTRWYCGNGTPSFIPTNVRGTWDQTGALTNRTLKTTKTGSETLNNDSENTATSPWDVLLVRWVSDALGNAGTIWGNPNWCMMARENNADADYFTKVHIYVTAGDTDTVRGTLLANWVEPTEWSNSVTNSPTGRKMAGGSGSGSAPEFTPVDVQSGDRIVVEMGFRSTNTHTTARTGTIQVGASTGGADATDGAAQGAVPWFDIPDPLDTTTLDKVYLQNASADATPSGSTPLGAWDDAGTPTWRKLGRTKAGSGATIGRGETSTSATWDVLLWAGVSDELQAQTIAGTLDGVIVVQEPNTGSNFVFHVHLWVMKPDGTSRGTLLTDYVASPLESQEWLDTIGDPPGKALVTQSLSSLAVTAGDRLVVEIGYQAQNTSSVNRTGTLAYGRTGGDAIPGTTTTTLASWLGFSQDILWLADAVVSARRPSPLRFGF